MVDVQRTFRPLPWRYQIHDRKKNAKDSDYEEQLREEDLESRQAEVLAEICRVRGATSIPRWKVPRNVEAHKRWVCWKTGGKAEGFSSIKREHRILWLLRTRGSTCRRSDLWWLQLLPNLPVRFHNQSTRPWSPRLLNKASHPSRVKRRIERTTATSFNIKCKL